MSNEKSKGRIRYWMSNVQNSLIHKIIGLIRMTYVFAGSYGNRPFFLIVVGSGTVLVDNWLIHHSSASLPNFFTI